MFEMIHPDKASDKTMENFETMKHLQISNFYIDKKNIFYIEVTLIINKILIISLITQFSGLNISRRVCPLTRMSGIWKI